MDLLVVGPRQAGRHAPPEDPPFGPALEVLGVADARMEDRPEGLDPRLVEREARPRAQAEARQVEPARLVPGGLEPPLGRVAQRLPERPEGRRGPLVPGGVECLFQPLDQPGGAQLLGQVPRGEGRPDRLDGRVELRLLDDDAVGVRPRDGRRRERRPSRPSELDLEPPAAVVGPRLAPELDRPDLGHPRRQADGHALGLRLAADAHQALQAGGARGSSRGRTRAGRRAGRRAGPSCSPAGRRPAAPSRGRSRAGRSSISSPSWASRGTTQSQGRSVFSAWKPT